MRPSTACGAASRWRWAEPCRQPSCPKCYRRFINGEIGKALKCFGSHDPKQLGWLEIDLGPAINATGLCARTTNRLRNTLDRERRRRSRWDDVHVGMLFSSDGEQLTLSGFVRIAKVAPQEFARVLADAWSIAAVRLEPFEGASADEHIAEVGYRWRKVPNTALPSFRNMRVTVGPRWLKATRHRSPVATLPAYREPMPVSVGFGELPLWRHPW
jgi:hypothetical protein